MIALARGSWRPILVGIVLGAGGLLGLGVLVGGPLLITHRQNLPLEQQYGHFAISVAARLNSGQATNPLPQDARTLAMGRDAYTGSCSECHGATGDGKGVFGQVTYPIATVLTTGDAKEKSDAALFWIVKNGLSFTAMPGFASQYDDTQIWGIVSYLRVLQNGQSQAIAVPTPTMAQLDVADPQGNAVQRGAAIYFAADCQSCHGATGNAPGNLALSGGGREGDRAVRQGSRGMPAYGTQQLSDAQLADLDAYMATFPSAGRGEGVGRG